MFRLSAFVVSVLLLALPNEIVAQPTLVFDPALSNQQETELQALLEEVLARFESRLGYQFEPSTVMVFSADPAFLARDQTRRTGGSYSRKLQAFQSWINAEAGYRRIHVNLGGETWQRRQDRRPLLTHELFHILQHELVGSRSRNCCQPDRVSSVGPTWLHEGSADYFERVVTGRDMKGYLQHARQQVRNLGGRQLDLLETRNGMNAVENSYAIGAYAVSQLVERAGISSVFSFYQGLGRGQRWDRAFESAFGQTPSDFYADFH
jgi:hypothetical protein